MDWDKALDDTAKEVDSELSGKISALSKLSSDEISAIAPRQIDKENLINLISLVKDATLSNQQKIDAINKINGSVDIFIGLLSKALS